MTKHPSDRAQRLKLKKLKYEKKTEAERRAGKVWRKLQRESLKAKEIEDDLRTYNKDGNL